MRSTALASNDSIKSQRPLLWLGALLMPDQGTVATMMTSSNGNIFRVTGHLCGDSPVPGEFLAQRPVTALLFSLICVWINGWVNNRESGDLRRHRAHYDVTVMTTIVWRLCTRRWTAMVAHACIGPWRCLTLDCKLDCLKCPLYISETEMSTIWGTFCYWQEVVKRHWCYKW